MLKIGDLVVYETSGVCRIENCLHPEFVEENQDLYYVLKPLFQDGLVYTPVNTKAYMRPVISAEEADRLIDTIPYLHVEAYHCQRVNQLNEYYKLFLQRHDCLSLMQMTISLYNKKTRYDVKEIKIRPN